MTRAVFLDKDGTLVTNVPYNVDPALVALMPGAAAGLRSLGHAGYRLIVVSNQAGVARGYFALAALTRIWDRLDMLLREAGVTLAGYYFCPHHPDGCVEEYARSCRCRKPAPGLLQQAAREHRVDLTRSWMIGDILDDIEAGRSAGCRTVLLDNGHETEWRSGPNRRPDSMAPNLVEAARHILAADVPPVGGSR